MRRLPHRFAARGPLPSALHACGGTGLAKPALFSTDHPAAGGTPSSQFWIHRRPLIQPTSHVSAAVSTITPPTLDSAAPT